MRTRLSTLSACVGGLAAGAYALLIRGALTLDLGVGRRVRPLGPIVLTIAAPREIVFDVVAGPYLGRTPRAMRAELQVWERASDMALAAHFTRTGRLSTTTVETVRFERPERISFRLVRGPVPHVVETYELRDAPQGTAFAYRGELGTDLWRVGEWWGDRVARRWEGAVVASLEQIQTEAERRAMNMGRFA
ncbi:MAG: SRPBCC family protein [Actinobacteria bacterium]|nr:MAG: SRPBCC family protein [Actinomycetota bacterium]